MGCAAQRIDAANASTQVKAQYKALLAERPERCVWGTNWPHPGLTGFMPNDADLLTALHLDV